MTGRRKAWLGVAVVVAGLAAFVFALPQPGDGEGAPAGDAFVHGIVIKNLSQVQKALLFKLVTTESQGIKLVA